MNVAIVYDRINKFGGAERVLLALHEIWPKAPLYTAVYDSGRAKWADVFTIHPSFLQHVPFARTLHELYPWATPMAFETFDFAGYDCVISVTSAEAKGVITHPDTVHICYCLTPTRYLWSGYEEYITHPGLGVFSSLGSFFLRKGVGMLREWDSSAAQRPDYYIAISELVKKRIEKYYRRSVDAVIYPPVETDTFTPGKNSDNYYITVARLVGYKRVDLLIAAANRLHVPLVVIGDGLELNRLRKMAGPTVRIISSKLTDRELAAYYQRSRAFLFAGEEDFGITAVEAQACGKSVLAFARSGMAEIVREGKTGLLYKEQTVAAVCAGIQQLNKVHFSPELCRENAIRFSKKRFQDEFKMFVEQRVAAERKE